MKYIKIDRRITSKTVETYEIPAYPNITVIVFIQCSNWNYQVFKDGVLLVDEQGEETEEAKKYIQFAHSLSIFVEFQMEEEKRKNGSKS